MIEKTDIYDKWFRKLKDFAARIRIDERIEDLDNGYPGDAKAVGDGVLELRIHRGPGYRVYYMHRGADIVLLLAGGDKDSQDRDIKTAQKLAKELK